MFVYEPCHGSGSLLPVCSNRDLGSVLCQSMCNLMWTDLHWDRFFSNVPKFPPHHYHSTKTPYSFIHSFICHWHYINLEIGMCRITPTLMIYFCIVIICVDCILHVCFECGFESYKKTWSCTDDPLWEIKPTSAYVYWKYSAALVMLSSVSCFWSTECFTQRWPQINNCRPWKHNFGSTHLRRSGKCRSCWKSLCRDMTDTQDAYFLWMEDCS